MKKKGSSKIEFLKLFFSEWKSCNHELRYFN